MDKEGNNNDVITDLTNYVLTILKGWESVCVCVCVCLAGGLCNRVKSSSSIIGGQQVII